MAKDTISILDGSTFLVSDLRGDIEAAPDQPHGFFYRDTRFLSRWILRLDDRPLDVLSTDDLEYFSAQFFPYPSTGTIYENADLSLIRQRSVGDGFHEDVTVLNHAAGAVRITFVVEADADFADLFEVKDAQKKKGELYRELRDGALVLGYRRGEFVRETVVASADAAAGEGGLSFDIDVPPHGEWTTCIDVMPVADVS